MSQAVLNNSMLNNVVSMVNLYDFIHSNEAIHVFRELSKDEFDLNFTEITPTEAESFLKLISTSDILSLALQSENFPRNSFPEEVISCIENINKRLKPFETYLKGLASGSMTNAEVEHQLLSWGVRQHARLRRNKNLL